MRVSLEELADLDRVNEPATREMRINLGKRNSHGSQILINDAKEAELTHFLRSTSSM